MVDEQRRKAEALFQLAADLPPDDRPSFLDERCAGASALRREVESLLAHLDDGTITSPMEETEEEEAQEQLVGQTLGSYKILQHVGEGGFGSVYMAEQQEPVRRKVALKVIKLGMDTKQVIARFEAERQALAMMEHANIARVFDAGVTDTGRPYFVMELVRGDPITRYCDGNNLTTRERLELFIPICGAVQHAHQKGVIHRDLKPSNILVTTCNGTPAPKVIDFGIAKATGKPLTDKTLFTDFRQFIGTPEYMSPEQAGMSSATVGDVDTRSDIYSLGVLLYELLTGTTPFDSKTFRAAACADIQRAICEQEPPTPSQRVSTLGEALSSVAACRRVEPRSLSRLIRGDLDWIVMKALEKDRTRRYETAAELASDVQHHLDHEPVLAGPPGAFYRFRKFIGRNRVAVVAGSLVAAALMIGLTLATVGMVHARRERDRALLAERRTDQEALKARAEAERAAREAESANAINAFFGDMLASVDPMQLQMLSAFAPDGKVISASSGAFARDVSVAEMARAAGAEVGEAFAGKPVLEATARETLGMTLRGLGLYSDADPQLRTALDIRRRELGDDHPDTLRSALLLGDLILDTGKGAEAEPLVRSALGGMRRVYGEEHPKTLSCASVLAVTLSDQCRHDEAGPVFRSTLQAQRRNLGPEHRDTLNTMWKWSVAYLSRRMLTEGLPLARDLYEIGGRTLSPDDSLNVLAEPLMGWWYVMQHRYDQGESLLRPGLHRCRRVLGEEHPYTCLAMHGLARTLEGRNASEEKRLLYEQALAGLRATRGRLHWQTLSITGDFARWGGLRGERDQAEKLLRALATDCARAFGEDDPYARTTMGYLADFLEQQGRMDESLSLHHERLNVIRQRQGSTSPAALMIMSSLAERLTRLGRYSEARDITRERLALRRELALDNHENSSMLRRYARDLLTCVPTDMRDAHAALPSAKKAVELSDGNAPIGLDTLALAYFEIGDNDRAIEFELKAVCLLPPEWIGNLYYGARLVWYFLRSGDTATAQQYARRTIIAYREAFGDDDPTLGARLSETGMVLANAGHYMVAEAALLEALERNRRLFGEEHEQVVQAQGNLAQVYLFQEKYELAARVSQAALASHRKIHGNDDPRVAQALHRVGAAVMGRGDVTPAVDALSEALEIHRKRRSDDVPAALQIKCDLGLALVKAGDLDEAAPLLHEASSETLAMFGQCHWRTVQAMQAEAYLLIERGQTEHAGPILRTCAEVLGQLDLPEHQRRPLATIPE